MQLFGVQLQSDFFRRKRQQFRFKITHPDTQHIMIIEKK